MTPPPLLDQLGHLNVSVLFPPNVTTPTMLAGFIMVNKSLTDLQAKCVAGCEEQLYINTDIIPYNLLKQLKVGKYIIYLLFIYLFMYCFSLC